jgi:hypothetical protein
MAFKIRGIVGQVGQSVENFQDIRQVGQSFNKSYKILGNDNMILVDRKYIMLIYVIQIPTDSDSLFLFDPIGIQIKIDDKIIHQNYKEVLLDIIDDQPTLSGIVPLDDTVTSGTVINFVLSKKNITNLVFDDSPDLFESYDCIIKYKLV